MPTQKYTTTAIVLHWLIALGIVVNVALVWIWPLVADADVRPLIDNHKSIGVTVLGLAIMRLLWRFTHRPPALPTGYAKWEVTTSHVTHWALYAIIFAMPLTGWIMDSAYEKAAATPMLWFGLFECPRIGFILQLDPATKKMVHDIFGEAHDIIGKLLYVLFALHVAGALKHQWIDRQRELQRMWPGRS